MFSWGGVSLCLSGAALFCLSHNSGRDASTLKSAVQVNQLKDLALLLQSACKALPVVVAVAGRVGSDSPISCEHGSLRGVILEETAEQHFFKHNDTGSWVQDSALILSISKEVPWYVEDGTGRVYVVGARGATGLELAIASEVFEESGRSLVRGTLDYLQGLKMLGVKRMERVLPTGTALTVVGEALQDDQGVVRIQRPRNGGPFYVSRRSLDQLVANLGKWSRWYKYMSIGFTVFGVYLIALNAVKQVMERRRRAALHRRAVEARERREQELAGDDNNQVDAVSSKREGSTPDLCIVCFEQEYNSVFVPCGHMCCCNSCASNLRLCPLCRRRIDQMVRAFRH